MELLQPIPEITVVSSAATQLVAPDVYFSPAYGAAEEAANAGEWVMFTAYEGRWAIPLHIRSENNITDAVSPYGYSGAYCHPSVSRVASERAWETVYELLRERQVVSVFLRQSPLLPTTLPPHGFQTITRDHATVLLQLQDEEELWTKMEGRCRTSIRKARKGGLQGRVRSVKPKDADASALGFRTLYEDTMRQVGASSRYFFPNEYYSTLFSRLSSNVLVSEVWDHDGDLLASGLFMLHNSTLHYHLSGSAAGAARLGANNLLIWQMAQWGLLAGVTSLHLGGGVETNDSLFKFKRSFGGQLLNFSTYGLIVDQEAFVDATGDTSHDVHPHDSAAFFPPFRRRIT